MLWMTPKPMRVSLSSSGWPAILRASSMLVITCMACFLRLSFSSFSSSPSNGNSCTSPGAISNNLQQQKNSNERFHCNTCANDYSNRITIHHLLRWQCLYVVYIRVSEWCMYTYCMVCVWVSVYYKHLNHVFSVCSFLSIHGIRRDSDIYTCSYLILLGEFISVVSKLLVIKHFLSRAHPFHHHTMTCSAVQCTRLY